MNRALLSLLLTLFVSTSFGQNIPSVLEKYFNVVGQRKYIETLKSSSLRYRSYHFYPKKDTVLTETVLGLPTYFVSRSYANDGTLKYESVRHGDSSTLLLTTPYPLTLNTPTNFEISLDPSTELVRLYKARALKYVGMDTLNGITCQVLKTKYDNPQRPGKKFYFDDQTGQLMAQKVNDNFTFYKQYSRVDSLLFPFVQEKYLRKLLLSRDIYEKVEFNVDLRPGDLLSKGNAIPPQRKLSSKYNKVEFVDPELSNVTLPELFNHFRGHRILIDIWATWCAPCKYEFTKYDDALYDFLDSKNVQLLFISIDKADKSIQWKKDLAWFNLNGYHMIADKALFTSIKKEISNGNPLPIPRYVLIDEKGNILSSDLGKPSSPNFREKINKLLE